MSEQLLTILKFCLLALIWLFFFRVLRAVWVEITPPKAAPARGKGSPRPGAGAKPRKAPKANKVKRAPVPAYTGAPQVAPGMNAGMAPAPLVPAAAVGRLVTLEPAESRGITYSLADEISVGRAPGCQVHIDDTFISQVHARVFCRGANYLVEDLGSTNGTYLNQRKVSGAMIMQRGDRLQVGNTVLELE